MTTALEELAKTLRHQQTLNERRLWEKLRGRRLAELKFRRQVVIGRYIADFVYLEERLIVEADGPLHDAVRDQERDAWLKQQDYRVLRFSNDEIAARTDLVLERIQAAAALGDGR